MSSRPKASTRFALAALLALVPVLGPGHSYAADTEESARPPALEGQTGCELWVGTVSGNDPSVLVEALLCEGMNGAVTGQLQWSSLKSGYSIRDIAGSWSNSNKLSLHDTKVTVSKPNPGWVFCQVDAYDLTRAGDRLNGTYYSKKCNDRATVALARKVVPASPSPPSAQEPEPSPVDPVSEATRSDGDPPARSSCACRSSVESSREAGPAWALVALALFTRGRRLRARSRAARRRGSW